LYDSLDTLLCSVDGLEALLMQMHATGLTWGMNDEQLKEAIQNALEGIENNS